MKETRDGDVLHIEMDPDDKIEGPREIQGPAVISSAEGSSVKIEGASMLRGQILINGCVFDGELDIPAGVTVTFAPTSTEAAD